MKKVFCIVASIIIGCVGVFLTTLGCIKKSLAFDYGEPYSINVYNKSTTTIKKDDKDSIGGSFTKDDKEYAEVLKLLQKTTRVSLLNLLVRTGSVNYKINYGGSNYAKYDTEMNTKNLVVELIYKSQQNVVVYEGNNTRVIPFVCVLFVIPYEGKFEDIVIYNSMTSDGTDNAKTKGYQTNKAFVVKGNPKKLISYVNSISK